MEVSKEALAAYQIIEQLVCRYGYRLVRVSQSQNDIWLASVHPTRYPVIRLVYEREDQGRQREYVQRVYHMILSLLQREGELLQIFTMEQTDRKAEEGEAALYLDRSSSQQENGCFPGLLQAVHPVADAQQEFVRISKAIEEAQLKEQKRVLKETKKRLRPDITMLFAALCILASLAAYVLAFFTEDLTSASVFAGAYYKMNVLAAGEYWRLFTSAFVHGNLLLLLCCMYVAVRMGKSCEPLYRKRDFVLLIVSSAFSGSLVMLVSEGNLVAYGSGAVIFGISGAYIAAMLEKERWRHPLVRRTLFHFFWMDLLICLLPGLSVLAHLSGFVCGFLVGSVCRLEKHRVSWHRHAALALILYIVLLGAMGSYMDKDVHPLEKELDQRIVHAYETLGFKEHAASLEALYQRQYPN